GYVNVACGNEAMWRRFCRGLGMDDLPDDPRFGANADRVANREELSGRIQSLLSARATADVVAALEQAEVPVGAVLNLAEVYSDPQAEHLRLRREIDHPTVGRL